MTIIESKAVCETEPVKQSGVIAGSEPTNKDVDDGTADTLFIVIVAFIIFALLSLGTFM